MDGFFEGVSGYHEHLTLLLKHKYSRKVFQRRHTCGKEHDYYHATCDGRSVEHEVDMDLGMLVYRLRPI